MNIQYGFALDDVHATAQYTVGTEFSTPDGVVYEYACYDTGAGGITCPKYGPVGAYSPIASVSAWTKGYYTADVSDTRARFGSWAAISMCKFTTDATYGLVQIAGPATLRPGTTQALRMGDWLSWGSADKVARRWAPSTYGAFCQVTTAEVPASAATGRIAVRFNRQQKAEL